MTAEWAAVGLGAAGVVAAIGKFIASAGRFTSTVDRLESTFDRLDKTLDKLADAVASEATINAVQNERLDNHETRLERLEER